LLALRRVPAADPIAIPRDVLLSMRRSHEFLKEA
jgi:hypothetical protein